MYNFHLAMEYPDGTFFPGKRDFRKWPDILGLAKVDFNSLTALDIATDEGWWAFWAEQRGADHVLAIDVDCGEGYDWGKEVDQDYCVVVKNTRVGRKGFDFHHHNLKSSVEYRQESVYNVEEQFDVVFNCGLLYHLRHPLLAIDKNRAQCRGFMMLETHVDNRAGEDNPVCWFYPGTAPFHPVTSNWSGLSCSCVFAMLRNAGFPHVYLTKAAFPHIHRRVFIAVVDPKYRAVFDNVAFLNYLTEDYFQRVIKNATIR